MEDTRRQIWFDGPDDAYLVQAAIRRYLHATVVPDVVLVPTVHGPGLDVPAWAASDDIVRALVQRFGGHVDGAVPESDGAEHHL